MITVVEKGRVVHADPDVLNPKDILEVAQGLIEVYGWNATPKGVYTKSSEKQGYTMHDALGEAEIRLSSEGTVKGSKDSLGLRVSAEHLLSQHTPKRQGNHLNVNAANDTLRDVSQIVKIFEKARAA